LDVDAYVAAHRAEWDRLEHLVSRRGQLDGPGIDELVALYARVATHLSVVRSASPDPALVGRLSTLVAQARAAVTGTSAAGWRDAGQFLTARFPAALYRSATWWVPTGLVFALVGLAIGWWVARNPEVQASVATPEEIRRLVEQDFEEYYSSNPAGSFAAQVWTNNAWVAALCLASGILILPVLWILFQNAVNVGIAGGLMASGGKLDLFFGLITPHGLLELTAVFVAAGAGLRWAGRRSHPGRAPGRPRWPPRDGGGRHRDGSGARPARLRRHRGVRDSIATAHVGPHRDRGPRGGGLSRVRVRGRPPCGTRR
jgi:uncharacterized membrane protein SpoIIM required for sporulation